MSLIQFTYVYIVQNIRIKLMTNEFDLFSREIDVRSSTQMMKNDVQPLTDLI